MFHNMSYLSDVSVATSRLKIVKLTIDVPWTKHLFSTGAFHVFARGGIWISVFTDTNSDVSK